MDTSNSGHFIPTEKEIRDLLPGYVLGNLDEGELLLVNQHLHNYPDLREEIRSLENTIMHLAYSAPTSPPPSGSRKRVLARARIDAEEAIEKGELPSPSRPDRSLHGARNAAGASPTTTGTVRYEIARPTQQKPKKRGQFGMMIDWWRNALGWKMYALATSTALALLALIFNQTQNELQSALVQLNNMQAESEQLASERDAMAAEREVLVAERERLATAQAEQESIFSQIKNEDDALIENLKTTLQTLDNANTELRNSVEQLESTNAELATANTQLETDATQVEAANAQLSQTNEQLQENLTALEVENETLQETVQSIAQEADAQERLWEILPTIRRIVTLEPTVTELTASASLWASADGNFLLLNGLAALPEDQTYQLWLITAEEDVFDSGLITLTPDDSGPIAVELSLEIGDIAAVGISIEPAGGNTAPTEVILLGLL